MSAKNVHCTDNGDQILEAMLMSSANVEPVKSFLCLWHWPIKEAEQKLSVFLKCR